MMDIDQSQRRDIDNIQNDKISLTIDDYNIIDSPFNKNLYDFMVDGYNWIRNDNRIFKYNLVENDKLVFHIDKINELFEKIITNIKISFEIENGNNNFIFNGVNLVHDDIIKSKTFNEFMNKREMVFDCGTFNYSDLDFIVNGKEFDIELLFNGNKSNSMFSLKNVYIIFEFVDKLTNESDTVVNRLEPQIDFYRDENGDLILQIGDDASGKGIDRGGGDIDTYTKAEIDAKLDLKVNAETGKGLSSNDYTLTEKTKLSGIESNANYYVHPSSHQTGMITESSALTNLETSENATQHEINLAIDNKINSSVEWSDIQNKPSDYPPSTHNHDDRYYTESEVDTALNNKQDTLVSGTSIKTINNTSLLGSGNISIGGGGSSVDIATTWGNPTSDSKVPSEKLAKDSLDTKANSNHTHTKSEITDFPSIPSKTSDLTNDGDGSNVFVKDNDSRLSDARTPLAHTHLSSDVTDLIDVIYPVGSIYMSVNSVNPSTLFGGTWEQIEDKFLLACGTKHQNGDTGGSEDAVVVTHTHSTTNKYFLTTSGEAIKKNSTAGTTGTKVSNLLQSDDAIVRNVIRNTGTSGVGKNMPPYLAVNVWKRTA